jgi:histidyl-tRNA synthetase
MPGFTDEGKAGVENLRSLFAMGEAAGLSDVVEFDMTVVRGLAYYTSTVFEAFDKGETKRSLFGGGRYDRLIELFGGGSVPCCGVAIGDQVLEILLREAGKWPEESPGIDVYVAAARDELRTDALRWVERLRRSGLAVDRDLLGRSLSGQLKEAARRKAKALILIAPQEKAKGEVVIRNMQTGRQSSFSDAAAEEELTRIVSGLDAADGAA